MAQILLKSKATVKTRSKILCKGTIDIDEELFGFQFVCEVEGCHLLLLGTPIVVIILHSSYIAHNDLWL